MIRLIILNHRSTSEFYWPDKKPQSTLEEECWLEGYNHPWKRLRHFCQWDYLWCVNLEIWDKRVLNWMSMRTFPSAFWVFDLVLSFHIYTNLEYMCYHTSDHSIQCVLVENYAIVTQFYFSHRCNYLLGKVVLIFYNDFQLLSWSTFRIYLFFWGKT